MKDERNSDLIDLEPQSAANRRALMLLLIFVAVVALAGFIYFIVSEQDSVSEASGLDDQGDDLPMVSSAPSVEDPATGDLEERELTEKVQADSVTPMVTTIDAAVPDVVEEMADPDTTNVQADQEQPRIFLKDLRQIAKSLKTDEYTEQERILVNALEAQLQRAQQSNMPKSEISQLEDALSTQLSTFINTTYEYRFDNRKSELAKRELASFSILEWDQFDQSFERARKNPDQLNLLDRANLWQEVREKLANFENSAASFLSQMALGSIAADDKQSALIAYERLLLLQPSSEEALFYVHQYKYPSGFVWDGPVGIVFAYLPAGTFLMGTPESEFNRDPDEALRGVTLTRGVFIGVTEITQQQWLEVMGRYPDAFDPEGDAVGPNLPIFNLRYDEVEAFCVRLSEIDSENTYRLPTEAEWEYACRAGVDAAFAFGEARMGSRYANVLDLINSSDAEAPIKVGSYQPNAWGLYDMHGNVWEMVSDWYAAYDLKDTKNPKGPEANIDRDTKVLRGGSFYDESKMARSGNRWAYNPSIAANYIGFRVVRETNF